jgi:hypothetical protein
MTDFDRWAAFVPLAATSTPAYAPPGLYTWLLSKRRSDRP